MTSVDPNETPEAARDRHDAIIAAFEAAWNRGDRPKISSHLLADEPRRDELLVELVHADLEFRIKAGESARVEDYLRKYPSLTRARETVVDLIRTECKIRRRKEPDLKVESYRRRFAGMVAELEAALGDDPGATGSPTPKAAADRSGPRLDGPLPRRFGKFELREKLGVGSSGVVYRAWDTVLKREVAVKVPGAPGASTGPEHRVLLREARNAIHLKHPNIVEILDAGPVDGVDCIVRAYIAGQTLAERLREGPIAPRQAAELVALLAEAVEYAHQHQIIHRDIKPSNILVDPQGWPYVMDFGLSRHQSGESTLSPLGSPGLIIGTPAYMSPEQARGDSYLVDARSDVHGLGVVLYELLTGSLPFRGRGRRLLIQIEECEPISPRSLNDEVAADLEVVCLKALAKDPSGRFQSAGMMANDLRSYLEGRPVGAKLGPSARVRPGRWWRSPGKVATLAAWSALILALVWTSARWFQADARRGRNADGFERAYRALLELGDADSGADPIGRARKLAGELAPTLDADPALIELAADARLALAARATAEGSDEVAGPSWDRAVSACEVSLRTRPGRIPRLEDLAGALTGRAEVWSRLGSPGRARAGLDRSIRAWSEARDDVERRLDDNPDDLEARLELAEVLSRLAEARRLIGEPADVQAVDLIVKDLVRRAAPASPSIRRRLAVLGLDLAHRQRAEGRTVLSEESAAKSYRLALGSGLGDASGLVLGRACLALARSDKALGRLSGAIEHATEAVEHFERLVRLDPSGPEPRRGLGEALLELGRLLDRPDTRAAAIARVRESLRVRLDLDRDYPRAHATLAGLAEARVALARAFEAEGRTWPSVANRLLASLDLARALALAPGEPAHRRGLADLVRELVRAIKDRR